MKLQNKYLTIILALMFSNNILAQTFNVGLEYNYFSKSIIGSEPYGDTKRIGNNYGNSVLLNAEYWKNRIGLSFGTYYTKLNLTINENTYSSWSDRYYTESYRTTFNYKSLNSILGINLNVACKVLGANKEKKYSQYFALIIELGLRGENTFNKKILIDSAISSKDISNGGTSGSFYYNSTYSTSSTATEILSMPSGPKILLFANPRMRFYLKNNLTLDFVFGVRYIKGQYFSYQDRLFDGNDRFIGFRFGYRIGLLKH